MNVYQGLDQIEPRLRGTVLTIGNFDGVHRAHRHLIETARILADADHAIVTVLTFEPHPLAIVAPGREPPRLSTPTQKLEQLEYAGADAVIVARSEPALLNLEPTDFVRDIIHARLAPRRLVEGPSFGFGKGRRGDVELLRRLAPDCGYTVHVVEPVTITCERGDNLLVSSSLIRRLVTEGDVERAALCLARPYALTGSVVRGDGRGRTIGVPTANLEPDDQLVPAEGVYAGTANLDGLTYPAAISIGRAPTFRSPQGPCSTAKEGGDVRIEAHLLDFSGDLYGRRLSLSFLRRIRDQKKFSSPQALIEQLRHDVDLVRRMSNPSDSTPTPPVQTVVRDPSEGTR